MTLFQDDTPIEDGAPIEEKPIYYLIPSNTGDVIENALRDSYPVLLDTLLTDRTTEKNIIWANDNYIRYGAKLYCPTGQIKPELITGVMGNLIMPRVLKDKALQKERTKKSAEVFTPTWVVKIQNDAIDKNYANDDLLTYTKRNWLEITCGEGPYMATRYDMETGEIISLEKRVGFVDRKLQRISAEIENHDQWFALVQLAFKASYGFEWNGDSLLLARENLLYTFWDAYYSKWGKNPDLDMLNNIAIIISYNVFQMDGLNYTIPLSEVRKKFIPDVQLSLFEEMPEEETVIIKPGIRVKMMNWEKNKFVFFDKGV